MYVDPKNKNTILLISSLHTFICILQYFIMVSGGGFAHTHTMRLIKVPQRVSWTMNYQPAAAAVL